MGMAGTAAALPLRGVAAGLKDLPIVVFSKVYQPLKLTFEESADLTAEAGLNGVDPAVRPGGEVLPEKAVDDLPRYFEALRKRGLSMPMITTGITSTSSTHAEDILRTARKLGIQYYRLGPTNRADRSSLPKQIADIKAQLKELSALNKEIGITAMFQNHSPAGRAYVGGDLHEMHQIVSGLDPAQIGVAFDIGHAWVVHGAEWRRHFDQLKPWLKVAYVKDVQREPVRWVPFGEGDLDKLGYFKVLGQTGYHAPVSMHIEYDWDQKGKNRTRPVLLAALQNSRKVLAGWLSLS